MELVVRKLEKGYDVAVDAKASEAIVMIALAAKNVAKTMDVHPDVVLRAAMRAGREMGGAK